jgi:hypothetical protein
MPVFALQVDTECSVVEPSHRAQLLPILTRLLYAKIVQRKVVGVKASLSQRRSHVLAWFAGMRDQELDALMGIVLATFQQGGKLSVAGVPHKKLLGFMNTLGDLVGQLGHLLERHMPVLLDLLLHIIKLVFADADKDEEELQEGEDAMETEEQQDKQSEDKSAVQAADGDDDNEDGDGDKDKARDGDDQDDKDGDEDDDDDDDNKDDKAVALLDNKQVFVCVCVCVCVVVFDTIQEHISAGHTCMTPFTLSCLPI